MLIQDSGLDPFLGVLGYHKVCSVLDLYIGCCTVMHGVYIAKTLVLSIY